MVMSCKPTIFVPPEGLLDSVARRIFPTVTDEAFASASLELVAGEWAMRGGRVYFTLPGLRRLASILEVGIDFNRALRVKPGRECLPPGDRE